MADRPPRAPRLLGPPFGLLVFIMNYIRKAFVFLPQNEGQNTFSLLDLGLGMGSSAVFCVGTSG
jgi:hypothetical protein